MRGLTTRSGGGSAVGALLALALAAGCDDPKRTTELNPEGPPRVLQVFMTEKVTTSTGAVRIRPNQLAFGDHPDIADPSQSVDGDDREVNNAVARGNQRIRVVFDELLQGNFLEEIACADGGWSTVPVGATPDDIAKCAGPLDVITVTCVGPYAVCVGSSGPVGILDENEDGAPDALRLQENVVSIDCGGTNIPIDRTQSFYQPSGNQLIPAGPIGINGLGPALIIVPANGLRTGARCGISFGPDVKDKDGLRVCAPAGGAITGDCEPGDTSRIGFGVEPLALAGNDPPRNATNVALTAPGQTYAQIITQFNAALDVATVTSDTFVVRAGGDVVAGLTPMLSADDPTIVQIRIAGGYDPETMYEVTVVSGAAGIADIFGGTMAQDATFSFTTRALVATPDAGVPDGGVSDGGDDSDAGEPDAGL
jgi:hypothetical protein